MDRLSDICIVVFWPTVHYYVYILVPFYIAHSLFIFALVLFLIETPQKHITHRSVKDSNTVAIDSALAKVELDKYSRVAQCETTLHLSTILSILYSFK